MSLAHRLYSKEIKKTALLLAIGLVICSLIILYITAWQVGKRFTENFTKDTSLISYDLAKLKIDYSKQLQYITNHLIQAHYHPRALAKFFSSSDQIMLLDRTSVGAIILLDAADNLLYSDVSKTAANLDKTLSTRAYLKQTKSQPGKIVIGELVTGILTKKPALPIAISFQSHTSKLQGTLIFSISLKNLLHNLTKNALFSINIAHSQNPLLLTLTHLENTNQALFFLRHILLNKNSYCKTSYFDLTTEKYIEFTYTTLQYQREFWWLILNYLLVVTILTLLFFWFYCTKILKPMLGILNSLSNHNNHFATKDLQLPNLVTKVQHLVDQQNQLIFAQQDAMMLQQSAFNEQAKKMLAISHCTELIFNHIKNKLALLTEELDDQLSVKKKIATQTQIIMQQARTLLNLNEQEIANLVNEFNIVIQIFHEQKQQYYDIYSLLSQYQLIVEMISTNQSDKLCDQHAHNTILFANHQYQALLYKSLFDKLIQQVIAFGQLDVSLTKVELYSIGQLHFIFHNPKNLIFYNNHQLTLCSLWALFNGLTFQLVQRKDYTTFIYTFV